MKPTPSYLLCTITVPLLLLFGCGSGGGVPTSQSSLEDLVKNKLTEAGRTVTGLTLADQVANICNNAGYDASNAESLQKCMEAIADGKVSITSSF